MNKIDNQLKQGNEFYSSKLRDYVSYTKLILIS